MCGRRFTTSGVNDPSSRKDETADTSFSLAAVWPAVNYDAFRLCFFRYTDVPQVVLLSLSLLFGKSQPSPYSASPKRIFLKITLHRSPGVPDHHLGQPRVKGIWWIRDPFDPQSDRQGRYIVFLGDFHFASPGRMFSARCAGESLHLCD